MKKVLIIGMNSYIGKSLEEWLGKWPKDYCVDKVSVRNDDWKNVDFSNYDSLIHLAGIAHVSADPKLEELYYKVNRDLAIEVALKAKKDGTRQFILMSSIIIYGDDSEIGKYCPISIKTIPNPKNFYGKSKLESDLIIGKLKNNDFHTVVVRTPIVYGPGCKGNFPKLRQLSKWCLLFPDIDNKRSMIYIDNLCEFIKQSIDRNYCGTYWPQNKEYVSTKDIIATMRELQGKKTIFVKLFNSILRNISPYWSYINKVLGSKFYDKFADDVYDYCVVDFYESIEKSLNVNKE